MELDTHICYEALKTRDARFDGQFFTGVKSTGIFCRPICPAQTPHEKNCTFYENADAAMAAGFRPCLRCRPESAPQSAAWIGTQGVVNRAVRLIHEGVLDGDGNLEKLANRLGLGERQLRRLFKQHIGMSPIQVAQTKRLMFAKKLLKETTLPITDIAFSSGFKSVRRFNDAFKTAFDFAPSHERKNPDIGDKNTSCHLKLSYRPPFDWEGLIDFLKGRAIEGVETCTENKYARIVQIEDQIGKISLINEADQNQLALKIEGFEIKHLRTCVQKVRCLFDLDCDPLAIQTHLENDPLIGDVVKANPGLRLPGAWDGFEIAVRAIIGQQISVKAARTILNRLVQRCSNETTYGRAFPTQNQILEADLEGLGLTQKRQTFLKNLAENWSGLDASQTAPQQIDQLCQISGIGPWTAHYIVMRTASNPDVFPIQDIALLRRFQGAGFGETHKDVTTYFEKFRPWRAYAALYLWNLK